MDLSFPISGPSSVDNIRGNHQPTSESFENVFALLDEDRSRQLVKRVIPIVTYTGGFEVVGRDGGIDPPTQLCSPCKELFRRPPPACTHRDLDHSGASMPSRFWTPHHATLFQLVDCCFSRSGSCHLCQLLWHATRREAMYRRSNAVEVQTSDRLSARLKVALREHFDYIYLVLNFFPETNVTFPQDFHVIMYRSRWCLPRSSDSSVLTHRRAQ